MVSLGAISECFCNVTAYEIAYSRSPKSMKALVMSIFLFETALSSALGEILTPVIQDVGFPPCLLLLPSLVSSSRVLPRLLAVPHLDLGRARHRAILANRRLLVQIQAPQRGRVHDVR